MNYIGVKLYIEVKKKKRVYLLNDTTDKKVAEIQSFDGQFIPFITF